MFGAIDRKEFKQGIKNDTPIFQQIIKELTSATKNTEKYANPYIIYEKYADNLSVHSKKVAKEIVDTAKTASDASIRFENLSRTVSTSASVGMKAIDIAMNIATMLAVSMAIKGIIAVFDAMSTSLEEQKEKVSNLNNEYKTISDEFTALSQKQITSPLDNPLTEAEKNRLVYLREYQEELKRTLATENEKLVLSDWFGEGNLNPFAKIKSKEIKSVVGRATNSSVFLDSTLNQVNDDNKTNNGIQSSLNQFYKDYQKDYTTLLGKRNELQELLKQPFSDNTKSKLKEELDLINPAIKELQSQMGRLTKTGVIENPLEKAMSAFTANFNTEAVLQEYAKLLKGFSSKDIFQIQTKGSQEQVNAYNDLVIAAKEYNLSVEDLNNFLVQYKYISDGISEGDALKNSVLSTTELSKVLSDTDNSLSSLAGAYKEQEEAGKLSNSTLLTLMENHENWVDLVTIENGVIKLNKDAILDKANATIQAKIDELEATKLATTESISLMRDEMQALISLAKTYTSVSQIMQAEKALMNFKGDIDNLEFSLLKTDKIIGVLRGSLNQLGTSDPFGNLADNAKDLNDELEDAIKKEESMLKAYGEAAIASIDKRIAAKRKEIEAINEQYEAEDDLMRLQQARDAYENAKAQKNTRVFYEDKGWVWEADQAKVDEAKDALEEIEREIAKKEAINAIEDEINSLENLKDKYKEAMDKIGMDIEMHNMQMQYMADFENGVFQTSIANMEEYVQRIEELMARAAAARAMGMGSSGVETSKSDSKDAKGYASGTNFVPKTGIYNVDEQGKEIIINSPRYGRLQLLEYGSSVIPANISQRLIELGSMSPDKLFKDINLNLFSANYQANQAQPQQNVTHIIIDKIVTDAKSFPELLSDIQRMSRVTKPI